MGEAARTLGFVARRQPEVFALAAKIGEVKPLYQLSNEEGLQIICVSTWTKRAH